MMAFSPRVSGSPFFKKVMNQLLKSTSSACTSSFKLRPFSGTISTLIDMNYKLREALPGDSGTISSLEEALFYDNWMSGHTICNELGRGPAWVVKRGEETVGYLLTNYSGGVLDVIRVGVQPKIHGVGVGRTLMEAALAYPHKVATLTVRKDNRPALQLYKKLGFVLHGDLGPAWVLLRTS
jgi:ribosomal protein S18 acetylase RimI-like enzyme